MDDRILEEQLFCYEGISYDEMHFYLDNVIKNCKDICDTENIVDGLNNCEIVELRFKKNEDQIDFNGSLGIGKENRCISGTIYPEEEKIIVEMYVERLCVEDEPKNYKVIDEFKMFNNEILRISCYDYDKKNSYEYLNDDKLRGKIL